MLESLDSLLLKFDTKLDISTRRIYTVIFGPIVTII